MFALDVPPTAELFNWPAIWGHGAFAINKVVILMLIAAIGVIVFYMAGRKGELVPRGVQNVAEMAVDFIESGIILQTMGPDGLPFAPFLLTVFSFIFALNLFEVLPLAQMPPNARIALPMFMAVLVWFIYNIMGIARQGLWGYFKHIMFPPGVPKPIYIILTPINLISDLIVRPFALMVRLFANLFAGHLILVSFGALAAGLFESHALGGLSKAGAVLPFALLAALTGFEILVAFLQAYIFTILAAVFTGLAMTVPDHH
ncbi:MAG TPA: F0F1 ATP synthase subunit A [Acidimicrobiales bacterium]|nr:F0F1 ATP synthase subunit A [Acidimicrobiales bacterium]